MKINKRVFDLRLRITKLRCALLDLPVHNRPQPAKHVFKYTGLIQRLPLLRKM